ncbi:hypothetical protein GS601_20080 [Myxacorys almedinensis A]|uniref:Iron-sulfur cluster biosynthesis family protein n=2 Tax=Myxacorys TaxID=2056239 RepID=A0A8J7Z559_9CYAN|nr:hypothetical protein [Myxacorys almedinensis A]
MTPALDPAIMKAVERLDYRVTAGDLASQAGLDINMAQRGLLALASEAGGHLQVAESGDVVFQFPQNFRDLLRNKYFRLRLKEWWQRVWRVLFYLIRISFGIVLVLLIVLAIAAVVILAIAASSSRDDDNGGGVDFGRGGGSGIWFFPDFGWIFYPNYTDRYRERRNSSQPNQLNFLEAIYSFLFGDGNPNAELEERRWSTIGTVIRHNRGAVIAEQVSPYLDDVGKGFDQEYEQYMLPVLTRFDGRPEVSPEGQMVYHFPSLQTTVTEAKSRSFPPFLREALWQFSQAGSGQKVAAIALGCVLLVLAGVLNLWLAAGVGIAGGALAFVRAIAVLSLGYSVAFLGIPLIRSFWLQFRNRKIQARNDQRELRSRQLAQADPVLQQKLGFAQQFAAETVIRDEDLIYTTETDLIEQESEQADRIDAEWRERLEGNG